ncbi:hypothetical protein [Flavobacterium sp.]
MKRRTFLQSLAAASAVPALAATVNKLAASESFKLR